MKKLLLIAPLLFSSVALAEEPVPYFGASYSMLNVDFGTVDGAQVDQFLLRLGAELNELVAAEVRLGVGLIEDSVKGVKVKTSQQRAAYGILNLPVSERITPYLLAGYTFSELKFKGGAHAGTHNEDGVSFGGGINWNFDESSAVNVEVLSLIDEDHSEQVQLALGFKIRF